MYLNIQDIYMLDFYHCDTKTYWVYYGFFLLFVLNIFKRKQKFLVKFITSARGPTVVIWQWLGPVCHYGVFCSLKNVD